MGLFGDPAFLEVHRVGKLEHINIAPILIDLLPPPLDVLRSEAKLFDQNFFFRVLGVSIEPDSLTRQKRDLILRERPPLDEMILILALPAHGAVALILEIIGARAEMRGRLEDPDSAGIIRAGGKERFGQRRFVLIAGNFG